MQLVQFSPQLTMKSGFQQSRFTQPAYTAINHKPQFGLADPVTAATSIFTFSHIATVMFNSFWAGLAFRTAFSVVPHLENMVKGALKVKTVSPDVSATAKAAVKSDAAKAAASPVTEAKAASSTDSHKSS